MAFATLAGTAALLFCLQMTSTIAQQYKLQASYSGPTFFDNFNFWTSGDPTFGYVHYVDQATAEANGMIKTSNTTVWWGVENQLVLDPNANLGRLSLRLISVQSWTHGLFIVDLQHMPPNQCGVWPAFWTLGTGTWPQSGEIDIIEYSNNNADNTMAMHTTPEPNCTVAGAGQSGILLTNDCSSANGYYGCEVQATTPGNIGYPFNAGGGGVYAMEWSSAGVEIWFFPRDSIPESITSGNPDLSTFGLPMANFQGSCNIDQHFYDHKLVFDTDFCGSYAGETWGVDGCPMKDPLNAWQSCNDFVAANPQAFVDAYWGVNYLNIFQTSGAPATTAPTPLSSVAPASSTSSITTVPVAEGQTITPSGTPSPTTTTPTNSIAASAASAATASALSALIGPETATAVVVVTETITVQGKAVKQEVTVTKLAATPHRREPALPPGGGVGGGIVNYCGVPGQACDGHQKRLEAPNESVLSADSANTATPIAEITTTVSINEQPPIWHAPIPFAALPTAPASGLIPYVCASEGQICFESPYNNLDKRGSAATPTVGDQSDGAASITIYEKPPAALQSARFAALPTIPIPSPPLIPYICGWFVCWAAS